MHWKARKLWAVIMTSQLLLSSTKFSQLFRTVSRHRFCQCSSKLGTQGGGWGLLCLLSPRNSLDT